MNGIFKKNFDMGGARSENRICDYGGHHPFMSSTAYEKMAQLSHCMMPIERNALTNVASKNTNMHPMGCEAQLAWKMYIHVHFLAIDFDPYSE